MLHTYTNLLHTVYPPPRHFFLLFDCYIPLFGPLSFTNGAFDSVPNAVWAHKMVVVEEPPLILFPGLAWGHFPREIYGTKSCTVDDDSSTSDSNSDSDSDFTTDSDLGPRALRTLCCPNPTTHPMTSSLGCKRSAKRTEPNFIRGWVPFHQLL